LNLLRTSLKKKLGISLSFYLVTARIKKDKLEELEKKLKQNSFLNLQPFGRALSFSLQNARSLKNSLLTWEEEDYCRPPLAQEKEAVLDHYFENVETEEVQKGEGWKKISNLPLIFPGF